MTDRLCDACLALHRERPATHTRLCTDPSPEVPDTLYLCGQCFDRATDPCIVLRHPGDWLRSLSHSREPWPEDEPIGDAIERLAREAEADDVMLVGDLLGRALVRYALEAEAAS